MNIFEFYRNFKAGMQYVLHAGQIVNNCASDAADLPLAAAQGKALWDQITRLNSDLSHTLSTDILTYAISSNCKIGFSSGAFIGENYTGDFPDDGLKYGTWEINKRTNNTITVKAFTPYKSTMWINSYVNTAGWSGWEKVVVFSEMQFFSSDIITIPPNGVSDVVFDLSGKMNEIHYASLIITGHNRSFATLINASVKKLTFAVYNLENAEIKIAAWGFAI